MPCNWKDYVIFGVILLLGCFTSGLESRDMGGRRRRVYPRRHRLSFRTSGINGTVKPDSAILVASAGDEGIELVDLENNTFQTLLNPDEDVWVVTVDWVRLLAFYSYEHEFPSESGFSTSTQYGIKYFEMQTPTTTTEVVVTEHDIDALAVDHLHQKVFFFEYRGYIQSISYWGNDRVNITSPRCFFGCVNSIELDVERQIMYYNNFVSDSIYRCTYNGSVCYRLLEAHMNFIYSLYLDTARNVLYWTGYDLYDEAYTSKVYRLDLETNQMTRLFIGAKYAFNGITGRDGNMLFLRNREKQCDGQFRASMYSLPMTGGELVNLTSLRLRCDSWNIS